MTETDMTTTETVWASVATSPPPIDDQLKELKKKLDALQETINQESKKRDALKADFTALEKTASEIKQTTGAYEQSLPVLSQEKDFLKQYFDTKYQMVTGSLKDILKKIDEAIGEVNTAISRKSDDVKAKEKVTAAALKEYEKAKKALDDRQSEYDSLKNSQKEIAAAIQKMKDLRKTVEGFDDQNDSKSMYVYLLELKKVVEATTIKTKDEYKAALEAAWSALNTARKSLSDLQLTWENAKSDQTLVQADLKSLEDNRIKDILEKVKAVNMSMRAAD